MNDTVKGLPEKWRNNAKVSELHGHHTAGWCRGVRFAANELDSALASVGASGEGLVDEHEVRRLQSCEQAWKAVVATIREVEPNWFAEEGDCAMDRACNVIRRLSIAPQGHGGGGEVVWQPMETAPRNGAGILVLLPESNFPVGARYHDGAWHVAWDDSRLGEFDQPRKWMRIPGEDATTPPTPSAPVGVDGPDFDALQRWALVNGHSGATDDEAFAAWRGFAEAVGRAFLKVLADPDVAWRNTGAKPFIDRVAALTPPASEQREVVSAAPRVECNCHLYGKAEHCPLHTQADYDSATTPSEDKATPAVDGEQGKAAHHLFCNYPNGPIGGPGCICTRIEKMLAAPEARGVEDSEPYRKGWEAGHAAAHRIRNALAAAPEPVRVDDDFVRKIFAAPLGETTIGNMVCAEVTAERLIPAMVDALTTALAGKERA
jgi:hypothetical protein